MGGLYLSDGAVLESPRPEVARVGASNSVRNAIVALPEDSGILLLLAGVDEHCPVFQLELHLEECGLDDWGGNQRPNPVVTTRILVEPNTLSSPYGETSLFRSVKRAIGIGIAMVCVRLY